MAVANGYGKVVTSGSVFMYDTGDTVNSYKGKPTTNRFSTEITDPTLDSLAIGNGAGSNPQLGSGGTCAVALFNGEKVLAINRGTSSGVYYENRVYWSIPLTTGNYYSWSAWVYSTVAGPTLQLEYYGGDYNWGVAQSYNTHTGTGWERLYAYANAVASSNTQTYCFIYINTNNTIYVKDFQLENQIYPTQFTTGTRSATQGLLPIVGNSTINLSNVSFDSNAQMYFDGTDDFINIPSSNVFDVSEVTVEVIVKPYAISQNGFWFEKGAVNTQYSLFMEGSNIVWRQAGNSQYTPTNTMTNNAWNHVVGTFKSGQRITYVNGTAKTSDSLVYTLNTNQGNQFIGSYNSGGYYFNGALAVVKVYNRAITAAEVTQNYNKYKTRFNLP
jgi:hypothetical protein